MSVNPAGAKRHTRNRMVERRATRDPSSSRDASEEDNDNIGNSLSDVGSFSIRDEVSSANSTVGSPKMHPLSALSPHTVNPQASAVPRRALHPERIAKLGGEGSQSGLDSPTYDGDVESSSTVGHRHYKRPSSPLAGITSEITQRSLSSTQRQPTPRASQTNLAISDDQLVQNSPFSEIYIRPLDVSIAPSVALSKAASNPPTLPSTPNSAGGPPRMFTQPVERTEEDIKSFVQRAIDGNGQLDGVERWWKTNPPPKGEVVRVYADGVYDLFHFGHALQLRQAKLSFPQVHLIVGVCSDTLCAQHKSAPAMTHAERCEAVRHCRWADEVIPDAPWVVDQEFLDKHQIDYIAHDELVYPSKDHEDVYTFAKREGRFVPTRRTPAISTSDLLERIVRGYRDGFFDSKLEMNGHPELIAADVDWDSSASVEKREKRKEAHHHKVKK
ncbi:uncharacterized protein L203_103687 [Cryptococcus depauperatus CBS 7841]|uniref:choline-phosphate cytidylyltransferase n=1 Tax=Cryptococcus depauperatus CBS 7841 TaxID=1295531 RepID=A0A1E3IEQ1_9TREE|nr:choline-phosphate cytidylyltransferase [Cryptococcus depauperatus CBS 7841]